eukprot:3183-Heterococcus_DN1.PRE.2
MQTSRFHYWQCDVYPIGKAAVRARTDKALPAHHSQLCEVLLRSQICLAYLTFQSVPRAEHCTVTLRMPKAELFVTLSCMRCAMYTPQKSQDGSAAAVAAWTTKQNNSSASCRSAGAVATAALIATAAAGVLRYTIDLEHVQQQ